MLKNGFFLLVVGLAAGCSKSPVTPPGDAGVRDGGAPDAGTGAGTAKCGEPDSPACPSGQQCIAGTCRCPAATPDACGTGAGAFCTNFRIDSRNCGSCGTVCPGGELCNGSGTCAASCVTGDIACSGVLCTDPKTDPENCGRCGDVCDPGARCVDGACTCPPGQKDCNGAADCPGGDCGGPSACTNEREDPNHCASCGTACTGATPYCTAGGCQANCAGAGNQVCGKLCVDVTTDSANCGACGNACDPGASCVDGACACPPGQTDCNGAVACAGGNCGGASACTDEHDDPNHCGACGTACTGATPYCNAGVCQANCAGAGDTICGGLCVDVNTDIANCGGCDNACDPGATCAAGVCTCPAGQDDCNGTAGCASGHCGGVSACTNEQNDPRHCGTCGNACAAPTVCSGGVCAATCASPFTTCGTAPNQYCADIQTDPKNCGGCAKTCAGGETCDGTGHCASSTDAGFGAGADAGCSYSICGTQCVDEQVDPDNCGSCGAVCASGQCSAAACECDIAGSVYADGTKDPSNACFYCNIMTSQVGWTSLADETSCGAGRDCCGGGCVSVVGTLAHCGGCKACPGTDNACCGTSCTNTFTDPDNCGGCGTACGPGRLCAQGQCACGANALLDDAGTCECPAGTTWNADAGTCVCPIDETWNAGARTCLVGQWANWPMPNPVDAFLPNNPARYDVSDAGIVTDEVTGLVWQQPAGTPDGGEMWAGARLYCAGLSLAGYSDWRLPTVIELQSLVDFAVASPGPTIDTAAFPGTPGTRFWSVTLLASDATQAWFIDFSNGQSGTLVAGYAVGRAVRCVRGYGAPPSASRYDVSDGGTVTDTETGLVWQQPLGGNSSSGQDWTQALNYCASLALAGGGWRVPSLNELLTLVDFTVALGPMIDMTAFPGATGAWFWTSSPVAGNFSDAWDVSFSNGYANPNGVINTVEVRCVR